jgi:hypothetical protein
MNLEPDSPCEYFDAEDQVMVAALAESTTPPGPRMLGHLQTRQGTDALRAIVLDASPLDYQRRLWRSRSATPRKPACSTSRPSYPERVVVSRPDTKRGLE